MYLSYDMIRAFLLRRDFRPPYVSVVLWYQRPAYQQQQQQWQRGLIRFRVSLHPSHFDRCLVPCLTMPALQRRSGVSLAKHSLSLLSAASKGGKRVPHSTAFNVLSSPWHVPGVWAYRICLPGIWWRTCCVLQSCLSQTSAYARKCSKGIVWSAATRTYCHQY